MGNPASGNQFRVKRGKGRGTGEKLERKKGSSQSGKSGVPRKSHVNKKKGGTRQRSRKKKLYRGEAGGRDQGTQKEGFGRKEITPKDRPVVASKNHLP